MIGFQAQVLICIAHGLFLLIHHLIGFEFVREARAIPFVMEVIDEEPSFSVNSSFRFFQLPVAVAALIIKNIAGVAGGVNPEKNGRFGSLDEAFVDECVFGLHTSVLGFDRSHHEGHPVTGAERDIENLVDKLILLRHRVRTSGRLLSQAGLQPC